MHLPTAAPAPHGEGGAVDLGVAKGGCLEPVPFTFPEWTPPLLPPPKPGFLIPNTPSSVRGPSR